MRVLFTPTGWETYRFRLAADAATLRKINELIESARRTPFSGRGKPEPLKGDLTGWWSRRITSEHRLVYRVTGRADSDEQVEIASCRYHY